METNQNSLGLEPQSQQIIFNFIEYLQEVKASGNFNEESAESIEVACQCLNSAFGVDINDESQRQKYSIKPQTLPVVFGVGLASKEKISEVLEQLHKLKQIQGDPNDFEFKFSQYIQSIKKKGYFNGVEPGSAEYEQRYNKARQKFLGTLSSTTTFTSSNPPQQQAQQTQQQSQPQIPNTPQLTEEQKLEEAEKRKLEGNQKLQLKQYQEAIQSYSEAINLNPNNAIYYSNRAAAYSHLGQHDKAIEDCNMAIKVNPNYSKAYGRLGFAQFSLGNYKEAVEAYEKALQLEPSSTSFKEALQVAKEKIESPSRPSPSPFSGTGGTDFANNPQFMNSLNGLFGGQGRGGGGLNLSELLSNPAVQNIASQMMSNPQMMNMAQNLMSNPDALNSFMRNFEQNNSQNQNPNDDSGNLS